MFSKALFKQSCKANGTMWAIITFAVCFMLACVMLISGNGNIGEVKNSIQDTIIQKEIDSQLEKRALTYYTVADDGLSKFDTLFSDNATETLSALAWCAKMPDSGSFSDSALYAAATEKWKKSEPQLKTEAGKAYLKGINDWLAEVPTAQSFSDIEAYKSATEKWLKKSPATQEAAVTAAYSSACEELQEYINDKATALGFEQASSEAEEMLGAVMYTLNPSGKFDAFYTENGEKAPADYDYKSLLAHISDNTLSKYISSSERAEYRQDRSEDCITVFLAGNITNDESVKALTEALSDYGVTKEKYTGYGYTYSSVKHMAQNAVVTYKGRFENELEELNEQNKNGKFKDEAAYLKAVEAKSEELCEDISTSFLSTLPNEVSEALEEIGQMDLYTLIVGSIFYKLAGLLLPIIYMIMASNNLISGQVDSGSMAYVLSTSTKRSTVVFTQAVYLIGSLLAMLSLTTVTGCICLGLVTEDVELTYGKLILLNVGAFLVLFALSGLCFCTSCVFDRNRRSMAIGGGLSIFALVAAMLGLFGSPVIPSVVRLESLNYFNYATVISLFDVISIIDGTNVFLWKLAVLAAAGILGYIVGALRFTKKDLPL